LIVKKKLYVSYEIFAKMVDQITDLQKRVARLEDPNWVAPKKKVADLVDRGCIEDLGFSTRVYNGLTRQGIRTVNQLIHKTEDDLLLIRGFGKGCIAEIKYVLATMDLCLADHKHRPYGGGWS
jgi:DNA-directed RNA polymerase subunit alpha